MGIISYAQNFEDVMLWRALGFTENGFYIDIGAQDPVIDSVSLAFHEKGWKGIHVEPTSTYADLLRAQREGDLVVQAAVSDQAGVLRFFEIPGTGISTADPEIATAHRQRQFDVREIVVPCVSLAHIFDLGQQREIHWLKIDVEGFEAQVLSGWGDHLARPWIVVVESTVPLTQIQTHDKWESLVLSRGYSLVYVDGLNRFYLSEHHPELATAFETPPNVFDGFSLNGTASATFHSSLKSRYQEQLGDVTEKSLVTISECETRLATVTLEWKREEERLRETIATLTLDNEQRDKHYLQLVSDNQSRVQDLLRTVAEQEQVHAEVAFSAQLKAKEIQLDAQNSQSALIEEFHTQANNAQKKYLDVEKELNDKIQSLLEKKDLEIQNNGRLLEEKNHEINLLTRQKWAAESEKQLQNIKHQVVVDAQQNDLARKRKLNKRLNKVIHEKGLETKQNASTIEAKKQEIQELNSHLQTLVAEKALEDIKFKHTLDHSRNELLVLATDHLTETRRLRVDIAKERDTSLQLDHLNQGVIESCKKLEAELRKQLMFEYDNVLRLQNKLDETELLLKSPRQRKSLFIALSVSLWRKFCGEARKCNGNLSADPKTLDNKRKGGTTQMGESIAKGPESANQNAVFNIAPKTSTGVPMQQLKTPIRANYTNSVSRVGDLLLFNDTEFVTVAYRTLLGRLPDDDGMQYYLSRLRQGKSKTQILTQLYDSSERAPSAASIIGLEKLVAKYKRAQIPILGVFYKMFYEVEGNSQNEVRFRQLGNAIATSTIENAERFNQMFNDIDQLRRSVARQSQAIVRDLGGEPVATLANEPFLEPKPVDAVSETGLSPRVAALYADLQKASAKNSGSGLK